MKIGQLANSAGCSTDAIRFYEKKGVLRRAGRSAGNQRLYGPESLATLRLIVRCRRLGLTLSDVKTLVTALEDHSMDCDPVASVFDRQIALVHARIVALMEVKRALQEARSTCPQPISSGRCGILRTLQAAN